MRLVVCGSVATDHLMSFPGRFADSMVAERLDRLSVSFLVDGLQVRRGGVGANIAFGLGLLGQRPALVAGVGTDFDEYRGWLERHGVDCEGVHVSATERTARFLCTTDTEMCQIASFYPGAMSEARDADLGATVRRLGGVDLVLVGADDPEAMLRHTDACRKNGWSWVADTSQQLARMDGPEIRRLVDGAGWVFCNDYERAVLEEKTGWSSAEVLRRVGARVTTLGAHGATVEREGRDAVTVPAVDEVEKVEPTGVGDAFRAGFVAGLAWGLDDRGCAQVGHLLAVHALETTGTQEYVLGDDLVERLRQSYGDAAAERVAPHLAPLAAGV